MPTGFESHVRQMLTENIPQYIQHRFVKGFMCHHHTEKLLEGGQFGERHGVCKAMRIGEITSHIVVFKASVLNCIKLSATSSAGSRPEGNGSK